MYTIGVLSDSHIPDRVTSLPKEIFSLFKDVDLIMHAGDLSVKSVLSDLEEIAPVKAVRGNMDPYNLSLNHEVIVSVENIKILLTHGYGGRIDAHERVYRENKNKKANCIIFGHTHKPFNQKINGTLMFNPGSCTDPRNEEYPSCGILKIKNDIIVGDIFLFTDNGIIIKEWDKITL